MIKDFLGERPLKIAFVPFALVGKNYKAYANDVAVALRDLPHEITLADHDNAKKIIERSDVIMVGGGNTFKLLHDIYAAGIFETIHAKVKAGTPYIGWSAGSNIAGPTIGTTNDMPVIQPESFRALGFFPFQINPHYHNQKPQGFNGETRNQRLVEFIKMNPAMKIVGLPEGSGLKLQHSVLKYIGNQTGVVFSEGEINAEPIIRKIKPGEDLGFLL